MGRKRMLGFRWLDSGHELVHQLQTIWIESAAFFGSS
jgi:hypothetical protein